MSKKVEVHNLNVYPYKEMFRDRMIEIPAKGFIEMEYGEAVIFKGTMNAVKTDGDGNVLPEYYKKIKIVQDPSEKMELAEQRAKRASFKCQACGFQAEDKQELHIHIKEEHVHQLKDPKVAKQLLKS